MDEAQLAASLKYAADARVISDDIFAVIGSDFVIPGRDHSVSVESLFHTYRRRLNRFEEGSFERAEIQRLLDAISAENGQLALIPISRHGSDVTLVLADEPTGRVLYWSPMWIFEPNDGSSEG